MFTSKSVYKCTWVNVTLPPLKTTLLLFNCAKTLKVQNSPSAFKSNPQLDLMHYSSVSQPEIWGPLVELGNLAWGTWNSFSLEKVKMNNILKGKASKIKLKVSVFNTKMTLIVHFIIQHDPRHTGFFVFGGPLYLSFISKVWEPLPFRTVSI